MQQKGGGGLRAGFPAVVEPEPVFRFPADLIFDDLCAGLCDVFHIPVPVSGPFHLDRGEDLHTIAAGRRRDTEYRDDRGPCPEVEHSQAGRRGCAFTEKIDKDRFLRQYVLIDEDGHGFLTA